MMLAGVKGHQLLTSNHVTVFLGGLVRCFFISVDFFLFIYFMLFIPLEANSGWHLHPVPPLQIIGIYS